jgi:hypothetical protein
MPQPAKKAAAKATAAKKAAPRKAAATPTEGDTTSGIDGLVDEFLAMSNRALEGYAELARSAGKRLVGEEQGSSSSWADDVTKFWGFVARDQVRAVKLMTDVFEAATSTGAKG